MKIIGIIPARYASTRFPGKPLAMIQGKSMINRVYKQALKAKSLSKVVVATDDSRIFDHINNFGGNVVMTAKNHLNGSSRCLEVIENSNEQFDAVINIQGDEPYIDPEQINQLAALFKKQNVEIATLVKKVQTEEELFNPNVVKVVFDNNKQALFFSRQAIPFLRGIKMDEWITEHSFYKHIGIYGYRPGILKEIVSLAPAELERVESLEQLRWIENGYSIKLGITTLEGDAVDTPEDLLKLTNKA